MAINGGRGASLSSLTSLTSGARLMPAGKRHERHGKQLACPHPPLAVHLDENQMLERERCADRDDHPAARLELLDQGRRNLARRGGDDDAVEWRRLRPPVVAVAAPRRDVAMAETLQAPSGGIRE